jgi:hypothetical protein
MEGPGGIATLLSVGGALYFPHFDLPPVGGSSQATMWKWNSAGTDAPAQIEALASISIFSVAEGEESSIFLPDLAAYKGALLVIGKEGTGGKELWAYPIPESTDDPQEDSHFLYLPLVIRGK